MRKINMSVVVNEVEKLCIDANYYIGNSLLEMIKKAKENEDTDLSRSVLQQIIENDEIAKNEHLPMCQDTGIVVVFLEIGNQIIFDGDIYEAINEGVRRGYKKGYLRKSVVKHPFDRVNTNDNTPAIVHVKIVEGEQLKIKLAPKGAGSENMSLVKMLTPAEGIEGVKKLVLDTVLNAGGKACPPITVGIGIGGNLEKAALIAKEAILRDVSDESEDPIINKLEKELLSEINQLDIGPMGFGGKTTALAVKINTYPCHIASLPVAINIQCHASRHKEVII